MCSNNSDKWSVGSGEDRTCTCDQTLLQPNISTKDVASDRNLTSSSTTSNPDDTLPVEMTFNEESLMTIIGYSILCLIATIGNVTVFWTLWRYRYRSRVTLFLMHLSVADLIVALIYMPLEIIWKATVSWEAGDFVCRVMMFFRAFGFYLSSFILVAISLDRYFAVAKPLSLQIADRRGNIMLVCAWTFSVIASAPQSVIFHLEQHPNYTWYHQCVTFNFFPTHDHELAYNLFNFIAVYLVPLVVIIVSYALILRVMSKKARENRETQHSLILSSKRNPRKGGSSFSLRASNIGIIQQAKTRTLKMTIVIVSVFIVCWTPYFVISIWYWFDNHSASQINNKVQKGLFIFAVSNSCVDPIVYGMFSTVFRRSMNKRWQRFRSLIASISKLNDLCLPRGSEGQGISMTVVARPGLGVKVPCHDVPLTSKKRIDAL